jgi:hypothetical protein
MLITGLLKKIPPRFFLVFFWMSIALTVAKVLSYFPRAWEGLYAGRYGGFLFHFAGVIEITLLIGAVLLWLGMFFHCRYHPTKGLAWRILWVCTMIFTFWIGADIYYLLVYRRESRQSSIDTAQSLSM